MMPSIYREVFELAGKTPDDYIPMTRLDPMYEVYFKGENPRHYKVNNNLVDLMNMAEAKGTDNSAGFISYLNGIYRRYIVAVKHFITRHFRKPLDMYNPYTLYQALPVSELKTVKYEWDAKTVDYYHEKALESLKIYKRATNLSNTAV